MNAQNIFNKMADSVSGNSSNPFRGNINDQLVRLLTTTSSFLAGISQDVTDKIIEDDPLFFPNKKNNAVKGIFSIPDIIASEVEPYSPQEILDAMTSLIAGGVLNQDESDPTILFQIGKHQNIEVPENPDIIIALNTRISKPCIKAKVLIAINTTISTQSLEIDKHILFLGSEISAEKMNVSNGFIGADHISCPVCKFNNVQFKSSGGVSGSKDLFATGSYDIPAVTKAMKGFVAQLREVAETQFDNFPLDELDAVKFVPYGEEKKPSIFEEEAQTETKVPTVDEVNDFLVGRIDTPYEGIMTRLDKQELLTPAEWEAVAKLSNSELRQILMDFSPEESIGQTKKELLAQLKVVSTFRPAELFLKIRKALDKAERAKTVVFTETDQSDANSKSAE